MSALETLSHHCKPLSSMTDEGLNLELGIYSYELSCRNRWGDDTTAIEQYLVEIEDEIRRRRVLAMRAGIIKTNPFVVEDLGISNSGGKHSETQPFVGAAKARAEWRPSKLFLMITTALLTVLLVSAGTMAGQRLAAIENQYAARSV